jgi:hypothetical protein
MTQIQFSAEERTEISKFLAKYGNDVKAVNDGVPLLHEAALHWSVAVVKFLVFKGADVDMQNTVGRTALFAASISGNVEPAKYLVSMGANVNAKDCEGRTPLHYAAHNTEAECVKFLVSQGADVNVKDNDGNTPLHEAAFSDLYVDAARFLVFQGADVDATNNDGKTPLDVAREEKEMKMVKYLSGVSKRNTGSSPSAFFSSVQSQWAHQNIGWGVTTCIAVVAFLVALANQSGIAAYLSVQTEDMRLGIFIGSGIVTIGILATWFGLRYASMCPSCGQAWGKKTIRTTVLDSKRDVRNTFETVYHRTSKGEVTGSTQIPTTKVVTVKTLMDEYRCKHCGHEWSKVYTTES